MSSEATAAAGAHPGDAGRLKEYWEHGEGGAKIGWGTPGDFDRCVALVTAEAHFTAEQADGYCDERHHAATGMWPAQHAEEIKGAGAWNPALHPRGQGGMFGQGSTQAAPTNVKPIGQGASGPQVAQLQQRLNALGAKPPLVVDGKFGPATLAAVRAFQSTHLDVNGKPLKVDGLVGPLTTGALRGGHLAHHQKSAHHKRTTTRHPRKAHHKRTARRKAPATTKAPATKTPAKTVRPPVKPKVTPPPVVVTHKVAPVNPHAAAALPQLVTIPGVDLMAAGSWELSSGRQTFTAQDIADAVAATACPAVGDPVIKLGHVDPRYDGEPAIGRVANMRPDSSGMKLVGDLTDMPGWLAAISAAAFPRRSIEGSYNFRCQIGHEHPFVVTGLAMLGVTPPGVGTLNTLPDIAALYGVHAAAAVERPWHITYEEGAPVVAVTDEDVRRAYYASGTDPSWWITELQMTPAQLIVASGDGKVYRVPFRIGAGNAISFEAAEPLDGYGAVAAARGTGHAITYASAAESRAVGAAGGDDSPWDAGRAWSNGAKAADPAKFYAGICLARKSDGDPKTQAGWALPYRYTPGSPPNVAALRAALAVLGGARGGVEGIDQDAAKAKAQGLMKQVNPDYSASAALDRAQRRRDLISAAADADDDTRQMIAALDATLDEAAGLVPSDTKGLPADVAQALALVVAAEALVDDIMDLLGIYDPDDDEGSEGGVAAATATDAVPNKGGAANSEQPPDTGGGTAEPGGGPGPVHEPMTGTHSHPHPAYGSQGGDMTHSHSHTHRGDANHAHAHASAGNNNGKGVTDVDFTDEQLLSLRATLGLQEHEELSPERLVAATSALKAAKTVRGSRNVVPPGVVQVEQEVWDNLQRDVKAANTFRERTLRNERDEVIDGAIRSGKFSAARKPHWQRLWDADPEGTREVLASLTKNVVPVADVGSSVGGEDDELDREFASLWPAGELGKGNAH